MNEPQTLRIASWNLKSCSFGLAGVARQLAELGADVVALQEVDRDTARSGFIDQARDLARAAGFAHHHFFKACDWRPGEYGVALVSRFPLELVRRTELPTLPGIEQRVVGSALVQTHAGPVSVHVTHLSHRLREGGLRRRQAQRILDLLKDESDEELPQVVLGDFNDFPGSAPHRTMTSHLRDVFAAVGEGPGGTFPLAPALTPRIDYAFVNRHLEPLHAKVVQTDASDHHALVTTLLARAQEKRLAEVG